MIPSLIGFLVVRALTFGPRLWCRHDGFRLILGVGLGIGLCSACSFLGLLSGFSGLVLEALLTLAAATAAVLRSKRAGCRFCEAPVTTGQHKVLFAVLAGALGLALLAGMSIFVTQTELSPHGGWDGVAIWNLRARFLYRAGDAWRNGFTETLSWSHPDYPLLLPAFIARTWKVSGAESQSIPIALAAFFTFG